MTYPLKLDPIDFQIISDLQNDGRMTNVKLAERAGISAPPCLRRLKTLEDLKIIKGYHADVNPELLGFDVIVFAFIALKRTSEESLQEFENFIQKYLIIRECYVISGDMYDFLLKIVIRDKEEFDEFLEHKLKQVKNIKKVDTNVLIRRSKWLAGVPIESNTSSFVPMNPTSLTNRSRDIDARGKGSKIKDSKKL